GGVNARAASCTRTTPSSGMVRMPSQTESMRSPPPTMNRTSDRIRPAARARRNNSRAYPIMSWETMTAMSSKASESSTAATERTTRGRPCSCTYALGMGSPSRVPRPAAATRAVTRMPTGGLILGVEVDGVGVGVEVVGTRAGCLRLGGVGCLVGEGLMALDGGLDAGEELGGLLVVDALRQRQLCDKHLAGLAPHADPAGGQAAVLVAAPQVADDLGDLVDVAGTETLLVGLVAAGPVAGFLDVGLAQHGEHLEQALLADDIAHSDQLGVLRRNLNVQVTLQNLEDEILNGLAVQLALDDFLDLRGPVAWADDR